MLGSHTDKEVFPPWESLGYSPTPPPSLVLADPEPLPCAKGTAPGVKSNRKWELRTSPALTWGMCPRGLREATSFALGQGELLEPHTETWNTSFHRNIWTKAVGVLTLVVLKIYDKMVLIMLLWSLLGLINHRGFRALFVQDCNSSVLSLLGFPRLAWWPNHIASVGKGFLNLETLEYASFFF